MCVVCSECSLNLVAGQVFVGACSVGFFSDLYYQGTNVSGYIDFALVMFASARFPEATYCGTLRVHRLWRHWLSFYTIWSLIMCNQTKAPILCPEFSKSDFPVRYCVISLSPSVSGSPGNISPDSKVCDLRVLFPRTFCSDYFKFPLLSTIVTMLATLTTAGCGILNK